MNWDTYYENLYNELLEKKSMQDFQIGWYKGCIERLASLVESPLFTGDNYDTNRLKSIIESAKKAEEEARKYCMKPVDSFAE